MRSTLLAQVLAVFVASVGATLVLSVPLAGATDAQSAGMRCACLDPQQPNRAQQQDERPGAGRGLDVSDEIAALEAIQWALTEVADGSTYVWHRYHGRLSGVIQPTVSFKDASGKVCRHLVLMLSSEARARQAEGVACRLETGVWQLEG